VIGRAKIADVEVRMPRLVTALMVLLWASPALAQSGPTTNRLQDTGRSAEPTTNTLQGTKSREPTTTGLGTQPSSREPTTTGLQQQSKTGKKKTQ
jgi:hypothetical protein